MTQHLQMKKETTNKKRKRKAREHKKHTYVKYEPKHKTHNVHKGTAVLATPVGTVFRPERPKNFVMLSVESAKR